MRFERRLTAQDPALHTAIRFAQAGSADEPLSPTLFVPQDWSLEAAAAFTEALRPSVPAALKGVEENTVPSWLWQRRATSAQTKAETSVLDVVARVAGAATYRGWTLGLWEDETTATVFFDEVCAALLTRRLVIAPRALARLGLDWAYGETTPKTQELRAQGAPLGKTLILQNDTIDSILRQTEALACEKWQSFFESSLKHSATTIAFVDTIAQWGAMTPSAPAPAAALNLLAFRQDDARVDVEGLKQAARIAVLLGELFYETLSPRAPHADADRSLRISLSQTAALLMSLGLPYDSDAGRETAAALAAIVTGTACATSARLAELCGACPNFAQNRPSVLRALGNRLRAAFDEKTDYDHLAILPQTLKVTGGADLVLLAHARYASEEALHLAQKHGLRHLHLTAVANDPALAPLLDSGSTGILPEASLAADYARGGERFERRVRPCVRLGLEALGYEADDQAAILQHIAGYRTLKGAPCINNASLREKGFDDAALARVEAALASASHLRQAFTVWTLGEEFCRTVLGASEKALKNAAYDWLAHMGFTAQDIHVASGFCCGHRCVKGVSEIDRAHVAVFETADAAPHEAALRMAAAVQGFVTDDVALALAVPSALNARARSSMVLRAWEMGMKSLTLSMLTSRQAAHPLHRSARLTAAHEPLMKRKTQSLKAGAALSSKKSTPARVSPTLQAAKPRASRQALSLKRTSASASSGKARKA